MSNALARWRAAAGRRRRKFDLEVDRVLERQEVVHADGLLAVFDQRQAGYGDPRQYRQIVLQQTEHLAAGADAAAELAVPGALRPPVVEGFHAGVLHASGSALPLVRVMTREIWVRDQQRPPA